MRSYCLFYRIIILLALAAVPTVVRANCTAENSWNNKFITFTFPAQIVVQADAAVGVPFYETQTPAAGNDEVFASCSGTWTTGTKYRNGWQTNSDGIAATNIAGVGVRIYWMGQGTTPWLVPTDPMNTMTGTMVAHWKPGDPSWKIQLIKTGDISGGTLQGGAWTAFGAGGILITTLNIGGGGTITPTGCTLTSPSVNVPLGKHDKSEFSGVGFWTGWTEFNINLQCSKSARINVQIDATQDPANIPGVMKLDNNGDATASGIGVELWYRPDNTAVEFGKQKFYYTSPSGGNETVQLKARYHQTAENITAGEANATATFTLTYQ
ncbi:type 1 fimbrial protein [Escherichia coli]|nr:type 1 fimbrial protein [Escherichia coli]